VAAPPFQDPPISVRVKEAARLPPSPPIAVRVKEGARLISVSKSHFNKLLKAKRIPSRKDGSARIILREDLIAYVKSLPAAEPEDEPNGPLLPAIEPAPEPSAPDLAAVYAERFKLIVGNVGPDEARLRAFEHTVGVCRSHYHVDRETAKRMVSDAIKAARAKKPD
jgi:excisionase family DNA binding protein